MTVLPTYLSNYKARKAENNTTFKCRTKAFKPSFFYGPLDVSQKRKTFFTFLTFFFSDYSIFVKYCG